MSTPERPTISVEEQARRRKAVSSADWSCRMAGLGKPTAGRVALDEEWISGQITRSEYEARAIALAKQRLKPA